MRNLLYTTVITVILLVGFLTGCSDEQLELRSSNQNSEASLSPTLQRALASADRFFAQIGATTRSPRRLGSVHVVAGSTTRSEADTLLFLVNYADNQGFALLGAAPEIQDIYAISPSGSLTQQDFEENPVLADFLYDVVTYAYNGSTMEPDSFKLGEYWAYRNIETRKPMLNPIADAWTQYNPYNIFTVNKDEIMCPVGCVNLSVGRLLSYYRKPAGLNYTWTNTDVPQFNFDWNLMLASPKTSLSDYTVAEMFGFLGSKPLLNIEYSPAGSGGDLPSIPSTITALGGKALAFSQDSLAKNIDSIASFMLHGKQRLYLLKTYKYAAAPIISAAIAPSSTPKEKDRKHAWIIDGVVTRERCRTTNKGVPIPTDPATGEPIYQKALPMWHCVWGFENKNADGWYIYLKDQKELDLNQYDPFSNKVALDGLWRTGVTLESKYANWAVFGGCFPEIIEYKPIIVGPII